VSVPTRFIDEAFRVADSREVEDRRLAEIERKIKELTTLTAADAAPESGPPPPYTPPSTPISPILPTTLSLDQLVLIERAWRAEVKKTIIPELEDVMRLSADRVLHEISVQAPVLFDLSHPQAQHFLTQVENQLVGVGDDMWKKTRDELIQGMQLGESIPQLSLRVKEVLGTTDTRARTIARTEVIGASNAGAYQQLLLLGPNAPQRKVWLSTHDSRTRVSHRAADGQVVDFFGDFRVGGEKLSYPGDPDASAANRVNCRCTVTWEYEDISLRSSAAVETFVKGGDRYVRDNHGRFAPKGGGGSSGGSEASGGEGKKPIKPSAIGGQHFNDEEFNEFNDIAQQYASGAISEKEFKYKSYYVKVKAAKRINKANGAKAGGTTKKTSEVKEPKSSVGGDTGKIKVGDEVTSAAGSKGKVIREDGDYLVVETKYGPVTYHKDVLKKTGSGTAPWASVERKKKLLKPSEVGPHQFNEAETKEYSDLNAKLKSGEISSTEYTKKAYYVKVKASKRINKASGGEVGKTTSTGSKLSKTARQKNADIVRDRVAKNRDIIKKKPYERRTDEENHIVQAHSSYTGSGYHPINTGLRERSLSSGYALHVKGLDKSFDVIGTTNSAPMMVQRGVKSGLGNKLRALKPGTTITEDGFMSTTTSTYTAKNFAGLDYGGTGGVLMHINVPKGKKMIAGTESEKELIFPRGTQLKFIGRNENGVHEFDML